MFFEADRIKAMREMIVSETSEQREKALAKLEPIQQSDFEAIYEAMKGRPVTIRLLDPPLHEFVPTDPKDIEALAKEMNISVEHLKQVISSLHEFNPMMGHRGCRLACYLSRRSQRCRLLRSSRQRWLSAAADLHGRSFRKSWFRW